MIWHSMSRLCLNLSGQVQQLTKPDERSSVSVAAAVQPPRGGGDALIIDESESESHHGRVNLCRQSNEVSKGRAKSKGQGHGASRVPGSASRVTKPKSKARRATKSMRKQPMSLGSQGASPKSKQRKSARKAIKSKLKQHKPLGKQGASSRKQQRLSQLKDQESEFADGPSDAFARSFEWSSLCVKKLRSMMQSQSPPAAVAAAPPSFSGFFEFAGGGGAEVACSALTAVDQGGIEVRIQAQSDWSDMKRGALQLQDPDGRICRFSDIMNLVHPESRDQLLSIKEELPMTQHELRSMMGIERCRIVDETAAALEAPECESSSSSSSSRSSSSSTSTSSAKLDPDAGVSSMSASASVNLASNDSTDGTDESEILKVNDCRLLTDEDVAQKIAAVFDNKGLLKCWRAGARIISAVDSAQVQHHDHEGIVGVLTELARDDHNSSRNFFIERRPTGGEGGAHATLIDSFLHVLCMPR